MPQQLKRDKFVFNFLWSLKKFERGSHLAEVFSLLLKGDYLLQDLLHLLMVKDFIKSHLHKRGRYTYVDLGELGGMFEHMNTFIPLVRDIVLNYDETFKAIYEEKFLVLKGDPEYVTLFEFLGIATKAFNELTQEGIVPILKKVYYSPKKPDQHYMAGDHLFKCYGFTGHLQDRSKGKSDTVNWHMWSDYRESRPKRTQLAPNEVGEFFAVDMDDKIQNIRDASARKKGIRACSPIPYKNLSERTKKVIDDLDIDLRGRNTSGKKVTFLDADYGFSQDGKLTSGQLTGEQENDLFNKFNRLPKDLGGGLHNKSVMQEFGEYEKTQARVAEIEQDMSRSSKTRGNQNAGNLTYAVTSKMAAIVVE